MRLLLVLLFFSACSRAPLTEAQRNTFDSISAASFLGDSFALDIDSRRMIRSREPVFDAHAWHVDAMFAEFVASEVKARGREFRPFVLDEPSVKKAQAVRESRWQKTEGPVSRALLDQLFEAADRQGIRYFFLLVPYHEPDRFPLFPGVMGTSCTDAGIDAQAYIYFLARSMLWDVKARKKIAETNIDPLFTINAPYGKCSAVAELADPLSALEDPVKRTMGRVVEELFERLGWAKP